MGPLETPVAPYDNAAGPLETLAGASVAVAGPIAAPVSVLESRNALEIKTSLEIEHALEIRQLSPSNPAYTLYDSTLLFIRLLRN